MKKLIVLFLASIICTSSFAYDFKAKFQTKHFAVNEVILQKGEEADQNFLQILSKKIKLDDIKNRRYQSTTVVFNYGSNGLDGNINEKVLATISVFNYERNNPQIVINDKVKTATEAGLYMTYQFLVDMVDNRNLSTLIPELTGVPLVITQIPASQKSLDYQNNFYITSRSNALIMDINIIDSMYYTKDKWISNINPKCTVSVLGIVDRLSDGVPLFLGMHGALNNIQCP